MEGGVCSGEVCAGVGTEPGGDSPGGVEDLHANPPRPAHTTSAIERRKSDIRDLSKVESFRRNRRFCTEIDENRSRLRNRTRQYSVPFRVRKVGSLRRFWDGESGTWASPVVSCAHFRTVPPNLQSLTRCIRCSTLPLCCARALKNIQTNPP